MRTSTSYVEKDAGLPWTRLREPHARGAQLALVALAALPRRSHHQALLIGHGLNDVRCKVRESDQIVAAVREHGFPVRYLVYPDEGHGFVRPENALAFRPATEDFLAEHLGSRCEPLGSDAEGSSREER